MHAWRAPDPPTLPGRGNPVRLHDSATGELILVPSGDPARMYVCGITPYDATHLGHAATYLAFDVLYRVWKDSGHEVRYVQNVTDIDDPLLERAQRDGVDWAELAAAETELFRQDMAWLRVLPPEHFVGAVESIALIVDLVDRLRAAGATYDVDGDIYFPVQADAGFGTVSNLGRADMLRLFPERGGDPDRAGKKDPLDALLWRRERPGEPAWDSPFGRGRPGWHVECSAIALAYLGDAFDVQGGGSDLAFPHHEMSASHAHAAGHRPFARCYVHAGMMGLAGEKMSKSRGNLAFAAQLREAGVSGTAVRLALLAEHYRTDRDWSDAVLRRAEDRLARWEDAVAAPSGPDAGPVLAAVRRHLAEDLDTPAAIAAVDDWVERARRHDGTDPAAPGLVRDLADALLGIHLAHR